MCHAFVAFLFVHVHTTWIYASFCEPGWDNNLRFIGRKSTFAWKGSSTITTRSTAIRTSITFSTRTGTSR